MSLYTLTPTYQTSTPMKSDTLVTFGIGTYIVITFILSTYGLVSYHNFNDTNSECLTDNNFDLVRWMLVYGIIDCIIGSVGIAVVIYVVFMESTFKIFTTSSIVRFGVVFYHVYITAMVLTAIFMFTVNNCVSTSAGFHEMYIIMIFVIIFKLSGTLTTFVCMGSCCTGL